MPKEKKGNILDIINKREILSVIWSSSTAYTSGQYVIYQNYIYRCIKNAAAGTAPTNATYWEKTNLASEITTLNSNLANIQSTTPSVSGNGIINVDSIKSNSIIWVNGYTANAGTQPFSSVHYLLITITGGSEYVQQFAITSGSSKYRTYENSSKSWSEWR